ncbi:MAG TPA: GNAT family N-acetyltransferase [Fimbriimonadaceae bacterium]|nr:GNAT family N-acetyltransferase [Fimbriimonadaceae bacterium]
MEVTVVDLGNIALMDSVADGVFDHAVQPELLHEFLTNPANVLVVAVDGGSVIGMATGIVYVHPDKPRQLFINEVGVDDAFQGRGIGKQLVAAILDAGKRRGAREAWVATEMENAAARALYRSTGGKEDPDGIVMYLYQIEG